MNSVSDCFDSQILVLKKGNFFLFLVLQNALKNFQETVII